MHSGSTVRQQPQPDRKIKDRKIGNSQVRFLFSCPLFSCLRSFVLKLLAKTARSYDFASQRILACESREEDLLEKKWASEECTRAPMFKA